MKTVNTEVAKIEERPTCHPFSHYHPLMFMSADKKETWASNRIVVCDECITKKTDIVVMNTLRIKPL